jgi:hypothetical protein
MCWQYLDLGPGVADPAAAGGRMRLICDAYGLRGRGSLPETILWFNPPDKRGISGYQATRLGRAERGEMRASPGPNADHAS